MKRTFENYFQYKGKRQETGKKVSNKKTDVSSNRTLEQCGLKPNTTGLEDPFEEQVDEKRLSVWPYLISVEEEKALIQRIKVNGWKNGTELAINAFFGTSPSDFPEWFRLWQQLCDLPQDWTKVRIEIYQGKKSGYSAKQDPLRCGDRVGVVLLGDEWWYRWTCSQQEPVLKKYKRRSCLLIQGRVRTHWNRELFLKDQVYVPDPKTKIVLSYKRPLPFCHWELIFF